MLLEARGFYTVDLKMKTWNVFTADWNRFKDGKLAADAINDVRKDLNRRFPDKTINIVLLGHSYGGVKVAIALDYLHTWGSTAPVLSVFVRPAIDSKWEFPEGTNLICWAHPDDKPLKAGKKLKFNHVFGDAGLKGFYNRPFRFNGDPQHSSNFKSPDIHDLVEDTLERAFPSQTVPRVDS